jgi:hypothetical protein
MYNNALLYALVVFLKKLAQIKNDIPYEKKNKKGLKINGNKPAKQH